ncbi:integrase [Nocardia sp. GAS34]|uniref:tyrosine-type recombinase/integrase n=1 Tax=unclassified Nocardia TaxID=2637762 RepID=UPI003D24EA2C
MSLSELPGGVRQRLMEGRGGVSSAGRVEHGRGDFLPWVALDGSGREIEPVSGFLRDLMLGDASPLSCRSYAYDLLRWFRVLWTVEVGWEQATEAEVALLVGWLRAARNPQRERRIPGRVPAGAVNPVTGKQTLAAGYAPATISHNLSCVHGFYSFHIHFGRGPLINPVPENSQRRSALAHRSPLETPKPFRRARFRPKTRVRQPRSISDAQWDDLFRQMRCTRDRALLACYVSSGARASELLGATLEDVDWSGGRMWVVSKGSRARQQVPLSPEALAHLAAYLEEAGLPGFGEPLWRTRRGTVRPLTYWAARRILQRAAEVLGANWTLHDLRHTAASRLARDPLLTLTEVQSILRHAHISTTALYTVVGLEDLVDKLAEHYQRPTPPTRWNPGYDPADVAVVFGAR